MKFKRYTYYIGIDPDIDQPAICIWNSKTKQIEMLASIDIELLIDSIIGYIDDSLIILEAGWLIKKSNWHEAQGRFRNERIAKNVGENHGSGKIIERFLKKHSFNYELTLPKGKINSQVFKDITKYTKPTNQDKRDAAMLVWGL